MFILRWIFCAEEEYRKREDTVLAENELEWNDCAQGTVENMALISDCKVFSKVGDVKTGYNAEH